MIWTFGAIVAVVLGLIEAGAAVATAGRWSSITQAGAVDAEAGLIAVAGQLAITVLSGVASAVASLLMVAFTVGALTQVHDGAAPTVGGVWREVAPRLAGSFAIAGILLVAVATLTSAPIAIGAVFLVLGAPLALAVTVGLIAGMAAVVVAGWMLPPLVLALPAQVSGHLSVGSALSSGRRLARGNRWRLIGVWLLTTIVLALARGIIAAPFGWLSTLAISSDASAIGQAMPTIIGGSVAVALTAPIGAIVLAVVYRMLQTEEQAPAA